MTSRQADLVLVLITAVWGTTFAIIHATTARFPPFALIAVRFALAAVVLLGWLALRGRMSARALGVGALLGVVLFLGFATQTWGLARTTPARAGFITGLYVVFVPLVSRLLGERLSSRTVMAVAMSVGGLAILAWGCDLTGLGCGAFEGALPERALGDRFVLLCALAYGLHVIGVSRWTAGLSALSVNAVQVTVVAVLASLTALALERPIPTPDGAVWLALLFLALVATVLTFSVMLAAQPRTTATRASLIYSLEAVFAALYSWSWLGEVPSPSVWLGGGLMLAAVVALELPLAPSRR